VFPLAAPCFEDARAIFFRCSSSSTSSSTSRPSSTAYMNGDVPCGGFGRAASACFIASSVGRSSPRNDLDSIRKCEDEDGNDK